VLGKSEQQADRLEGIQLPGSVKQQLISQFANDTSFMLRAIQSNATNLIRLLENFKDVAGLEINWTKSHAYWQADVLRPPWTNNLQWQWTDPGAMSKLLSTIFGIDLETYDIDKFLMGKIRKKLSYWTTTHLSLSGRVTIINQVLLATLWYFITAWHGSRGVLRKITSLMRNFLWSNKEYKTRIRVNWDDCCIKRKNGGLGIIDPIDALKALLSKWIICAYMLGETNLQILLHHKLSQFQPVKRLTWPPNPTWAFVKNHIKQTGSRIWNQICKAWARLVKSIRPCPPTTREGLLNKQLWWNFEFKGGDYNMSQERALTLHRKGLR
jgi:hypothetical protein